MPTALQQLADHGQSAWIHQLSRDWIHDRDHGLPRLISRGIRGAVSNAAALATALAHTTAYDEQIRALLPVLDDSEGLRRQLVRLDAQQACDLLADAAVGGRPLDGVVAVDVDPGLVGDAGASVSQAQWMAEAVNRPNLLVGIAAVGNGLIAIEDATARGLSVMATGVYSPSVYRETATAYRRGLARLVAAGGDPGTVTSVASVPLAALDDKADLRLRAMDRNPELIGTLAVATAKLIRGEQLSLFSGSAWERLAALGATPQRCVWSGLTVAGEPQPDLRYVEELIGPDTAALLSPHTAEAFLAGGRSRPTLDLQLAGAQRILSAHVKAGVSPKLITEVLRSENVARGAEAFRDVRAVIDDKRARQSAAASSR